MRNRIVIILVNYNSFYDTKACVNCIALTNTELPFIVLVDNNSNNQGELSTLQQEYKDLKIILNNENIGFGRANNIGIDWAQKNLDFDFLLLLNNDTLIEQSTLSYLISAFAKDENIGITTGKTFYESNRNVVWYGGGDINYVRGWPKLVDYNKEPTPTGANNTRYVGFVSGCTMMFSKASISAIKGFDTDYFMYCEDLELCIRAQKLGFKLYYESKAIIYHKVQGSSKKENSVYTGDHPKNPNLSFLFYHMKTNQYLTFKKHLTGIAFLKFLIIYWIEFGLKSIIILLNNRRDMLPVFFKVIKKNLIG